MRRLTSQRAQLGIVVPQLKMLLLQSPQHVFCIAHELYGRQVIVLQLGSA